MLLQKNIIPCLYFYYFVFYRGKYGWYCCMYGCARACTAAPTLKSPAFAPALDASYAAKKRGLAFNFPPEAAFAVLRNFLAIFPVLPMIFLTLWNPVPSRCPNFLALGLAIVQYNLRFDFFLR